MISDVQPDFYSAFLVGLVEDLPDCGGNDRLLPLGHMRNDVAHQVQSAPLSYRIGDPPARRCQTGVGVRDIQFQTIGPALLEAAQGLGPKVSASERQKLGPMISFRSSRVSSVCS